MSDDIEFDFAANKLRRAFSLLENKNIFTLFNFPSSQSMALAHIDDVFQKTAHRGLDFKKCGAMGLMTKNDQVLFFSISKTHGGQSRAKA